ncbi:MAG: GNAT family N-acetyltransferase [Thalassospira sp.]|uniref:GNAT family N-acetyltransferase n=1 Tax=Thalassospira sp. GB04J01 TaxID=1485225 RepID=UPI000C1214D2|nr:GNAT family protein [Thalassospira sp. GB04J01]MBV17786.1 GNAT family N-acetyltransferase [Thalassospira sp.]|tara:strand:+ start:29774 stop:30484 length:711 start_codon:yes stop_codon:yes gene_type:complete
MTAPHKDDFGKPVGQPIDNWSGCEFPPRSDMVGNHVIVSPLDVARDAQQLFDANSKATDGSRFTYLPTNAFDDLSAYKAWLDGMTANADPILHAIIDKATNRAVGVAAFMRIDAANGVVEVGNINYAPALSKTIGGTEAMYLMMKRTFDELGYRRYEWKCDDQNAPSRAAAARYGFTYEGTFRNHMIYKGRNRDTAWFSITADEWPAIRAGFEAWMSPDNFDENGAQRTRLQDLRG